MSLFDRLRARPAWKSPDPAARMVAVRQLPVGSELLAEIARNDSDPHVRRAALHRAGALDLLIERTREDSDQGVREAAADALLRHVLDAGTEEEGDAALAAIQDQRALVEVASRAPVAAFRARAVARVTSPRSLFAVARKGPDPETRRTALDRLTESVLVAELALKCDHKDVAVAAVERLEDLEALAAVAVHGRHKAAVRRAQERMAELRPPPPEVEPSPEAPEPEPEPAAREPEPALPMTDPAVEPVAIEQEALVLRRALCARLEALSDDADEGALAALREGWQRAPVAEGAEAEALEGRFGKAAAAWEERRRIAQDKDARRAREVAEREAREKDSAENKRRLTELADRLESLAGLEQPPLKDCDRALREVRAALESPGAFPSRHDREELLARLKAGKAALYPRVQELRESDEWTRWSNVAVQEELAGKMEALLEEKDLPRAARGMRELEQRWQEARKAPKDEGDDLWRRFKTARDQVNARCQLYFTQRKGELRENLKRKQAFCEEAESLAESKDWVATARRLQELQGAWKTVGPVPRTQAEAVWKRFRAACDRFFTRRKEDRSRRGKERAQNLGTKEALLAQAETLADSLDWEGARSELRRLQEEWKSAGPVRKDKAEQLATRFQAAQDRFHDRYRRRHEIEAARVSGELEAICARLEALAEQPDDELVGQVREAQGEWRRKAGGGAPAALAARFDAALGKVVEGAPAAFEGTELDPAANRAKMEKLCQTVEELVPAPEEQESPAERLARELREALATRTMGGVVVDDKARRKALRERVEAARGGWARLGPVPGSEELRARFEEACRKALAMAG